LRQVRELVWVWHFESVDVLGRFHQNHRFRRLAHGADYFVVPSVADEQDRVAGFGVANRLQMHFRHQRASRVDGPQTAGGRGLAHLRRNPVSGIHQRRSDRHFLQLVDEYHAFAAEAFHDILVVDDLVVHI
jgi:hypothetical protein